MSGVMQLLVAAFLGELFALVLGLPVPGPAVGMSILFVAFVCAGWQIEGIERLFDALAPHFGVVFVPAAVGFIASLDLLAHAWLAAAMAVLVATCLAVLTVGLAFQAVARICARGETS